MRSTLWVRLSIPTKIRNIRDSVECDLTQLNPLRNGKSITQISLIILCVALVRTDNLGTAYIIRAIRIGKLGITLAVTSNRSTLMTEPIFSSDTSGRTGATRRNFPETSFF